MSRRDTSAERPPRDDVAEASTGAISPELPESAGQEGRKVRRLVLKARDRAAEPVKKRLRQDRENAPQRLKSLLAHVEEHLFDADLTVKTALKATGGNWDWASLARGYLGVPLREYFRAAQIETARGLPPVLWRDYGLQAATGEIASAVGLPVLKSFCNWYVQVSGEPPELLVWPGLLPPGLDDYTRNRIARGNRRPGDFAALLAELAGIEAEDPDFEENLLENLDPVERAKAETVRRIHRDRDSLPDHLKPLLGYIAKNIFQGLNATGAISESGIRDKENVGEQLRFHLGETVKSYLTKRWVETFAFAVAASGLNIETIFKSLGQDSKRTVYRWFQQHTGENPGDLRRFGSAAEELVDAETWRLAGHGVPWAVVAVKDCLRALAGIDAEPPEPAADDGILARLETDVRAHPLFAASVAVDRMWRDPGLIHDCLRAALDSSHPSRLFGGLRALDIGSSELAQIACMAAQARLRKTRQYGADQERSLTGEAGLEEERVALTELVLGLTTLRDQPAGCTVRESLTVLRSGLDRLAKGIGEETERLLQELDVARATVRECLSRAVGLEHSVREEAVEIACGFYEANLLRREDDLDGHRWALASRAEMARIFTKYVEAASLMKQVDLTSPFADMAISASVRRIASLIHAEAGDCETALQLLDDALFLFDALEMTSDAIKARLSRGAILSRRGDEMTFAQFLACWEMVGDDPLVKSWIMTSLIIAKYYFQLDDELPFSFAEFVASAELSEKTRPWIPFCKALMEPEPRVAQSLFLRAERALAASSQPLQATVACLFAALENAKVGRLLEAQQLGIKAAMALKLNQAFGGRLALAAETFLASLSTETNLGDRIRILLQKVQMPYRSSEA